MARTIEYYFTVNSPWTYLGHGLFLATARRHGVAVAYKPVPLFDVFEATGSLPLPKRPPARQRYRWVELQRWRERRGKPLNLQPSHFPLDPTLINRSITAVIAEGHDPAALIGAALAGVWAEDVNLGDQAVVAALLSRHGFDANAIMAASESDAIGEIYARNGREAIAADVFGAPGYVMDGEVFWGQDRLELLDDALASGRQPYKSLS